MRRLLVICCVLLFSVGFFMAGCEKKESPSDTVKDVVEDAPTEAPSEHPAGDHPTKEDIPAEGN